MQSITPIISFKSSPEMFEKERSGVKPNTVREIPEEEFRLHGLVLKNGVLYKDKCPTLEPFKYIMISNSETYNTFIRDLTDVSYVDGRYVFSWDPSTWGAFND